MRTVTVAVCVLFAALAGGAVARATTSPAPVTVTTPQPAPAQPRATLDVCRSAIAVGDRAAVFSGTMPPLVDAYRMRMRFDLYTRRTSTDAWRRLAVPKWSVWHISKPRVPGFVFTKLINGLDAPATYRATVRFRWYDEQSRVIREAERKSPTCAQQGPNADLQIGAVAAAPLPGGQLRYAIVVRNEGLRPSGEFVVQLVLDGVKRPSPVAVALAAGQERTVTVDAPACTGKRLLLSVDLKDPGSDADRRAAPATRPCPV